MSYTSMLRLVSLCFCVTVASCCLCSNYELCKPVETKPAKELVVFAIPANDSWKKWNWTEITNVVMGSFNTTYDLYCFAHSKHVRVTTLVGLAVDDFPKLSNKDFRQQVIKGWINELMLYNLDGLNIDIEGPAYTQDIVDGISALTDEAYKELKNMNPDYILTFDIPYTPILVGCFSGYCYDYVALSKSTDYMIVMDYDATIDRLIASANSPINLLKESYNLYLVNFSINPMDLVMAVPWYGYDYTCSHFYNKTGHDLCVILTTGGTQVSFSEINEVFSQNIGGLKWDDIAASPYFTTKENGVFHQYRFDNVESLIIKYQLALNLGLRGLGMFQSRCLDYSSTVPSVMKETASMWNSISEYVAKMKVK